MSGCMTHELRRTCAFWILAFALSVACAALQAQDAFAYDENGDPVVVSIGDSYSSGEGIELFYDQDLPMKEKVESQDWLAHRSELCWSGRLVVKDIDGNEFLMKDHRDTNWYFVASSGAVNANFYGPQSKPYVYEETVGAGNSYHVEGEGSIIPQADVFYGIESGTTDYVTVTMGGNDVGFVDIVTTAAMNDIPVLERGNLRDKLGNVWGEFYKDQGVRDYLKLLYGNIAYEAGPQTKIIVAGYPELISREGSGFLFSAEDAKLIDDSVQAFNDEIQNLVEECQQEGMNIYFVSVQDEFAGHEAYTSDEYINRVKINAQPQDLKPEGPSAYSVHPNDKGAAAYARCVQRMIDDIQECEDNGVDPRTLMGDSKVDPNDASSRHVVLALDTSGSMDGEPLDETKTATREFASTIFKSDADVCLVSYDSSARNVVDSTSNEYVLKSAARDLSAGGGTNIEDALRVSYERLEGSGSDKRIIVLMSDGEANEGLVGDDLIAYANDIKADGVTIYTLGFFQSVSDKAECQRVMEGIASPGCHYEVDDASQLRYFFGDIGDDINGTRFIYVRIACPVDVRVSTPDGVLDSSDDNLSTRADFGSLTFEEARDGDGEADDEEAEDRVKILRLKEGEPYNVEITGTGSGTMNCTVGFEDENGDYADLREFEDVPVNRNMQADMTAEVSDITTLKVDEDGDGSYDVTYAAEANSTAEIMDNSRVGYYTALALCIAALAAVILGVLYTAHRVRTIRR